ncbi:MAG: alpha/beta fold hydrolase [Proteobacteria bacterium]|nr:alpha/beta fold hydrolase [Pseudomonadota bacterium]
MAVPLAFEATEGTAAIGDIQVASSRVGNGQTVVFVHGLAEDRHSWDDVLGRLSGSYSCHAVDLRGHGATTVGRPLGTSAQLAQDLTGYLANVSGPAICVGFSLGGVVVLEAALQRPDLMRKAIVVGTSSKVGRAAAQFFEQRIALLNSDPAGFREALAVDTAAQIALRKEEVAKIAKLRVAAVGDGAGYINAARAMIALASEPLTERLRSIRVPVHIIQGAADAFCPKKAADILREAMPTASYSEIPEAGHLMSVDQPELLSAEIARALRT